MEAIIEYLLEHPHSIWWFVIAIVLILILTFQNQEWVRSFLNKDDKKLIDETCKCCQSITQRLDRLMDDYTAHVKKSDKNVARLNLLEAIQAKTNQHYDETLKDLKSWMKELSQDIKSLLNNRSQ